MRIEDALDHGTHEIIWAIEEHRTPEADARKAVEAIDRLRAEIVRRWLSNP